MEYNESVIPNIFHFRLPTTSKPNTISDIFTYTHTYWNTLHYFLEKVNLISYLVYCFTE